MYYKVLYKVLLLLALAGVASAADYKHPYDVMQGLLDHTDSKYLTQSKTNIMMMEESPAYWIADQGEDLFHKKRGSNKVSLESCDFGKGPGVLQGAFVEMPRYFADTGRVMDLETRLVHCMTNIQGFSSDDPAVKKRHGSSSDMMKLQTYIASQSSGYKWNPPMQHPLEKAMRDAGEVMFYRRAGNWDFSCNSCHGSKDKRIRASVLAHVDSPEEWSKAISWPSYRVGKDQMFGTQIRVNRCYWQMRQGFVFPGSDASIAVISFWTDKARGQPAILPDVKR